MSKIEIQRYRAPIPEIIQDQVLEIVSNNVTSLSMTHPPTRHPRFNAHKAALKLEITTYLESPYPLRTELVTAMYDDRVAGFTLCGFPYDETSSECGIYYTAVSKAFRDQGLMSLMVRDIVARHAAVALSCDVSLVPRYERYGFRCHSLRNHQIIMYIGNPVEETALIESSSIWNEPIVMEEKRRYRELFTTEEIHRADRDHEKKLKAEKEKAKRYLALRKR